MAWRVAAHLKWVWTPSADLPNFSYYNIAHHGVLISMDGMAIDASHVLTDGARIDANGYTWDPLAEEWVRDGSLSAGLPVGGGVIGTRTYHFSDKEYDLNADGRFNRFDPPVLQAQIGSTDPALLDKFDFNDSDTIDQSDVDVLTALIDAGIQAGVLGDYNRNGYLTCEDFPLMYPQNVFTTAVLGEPAYRIELDADLDGDLDVSDQCAIRLAYGGDDLNEDLIPDACQGACCDGGCSQTFRDDCFALGGEFLGNNIACGGLICLCPADSNCDGFRNWNDIDYFVAAMNDNVATWEAMFAPGLPTCPFANNDVNGNGSVNWQDLDPFVALMNTACRYIP